MLVCYLHCCRRLFITPTAPPSPAWQSSSLGSSHAAAVPPQRREGDGELRCRKAMPYAQQGQHHRLRFHLLCTGCGEQPAVPTSWGADSPGPHSVGSYSVRAGLPLIPGTAPIHPWAQTPPIPGHRHPAFPVLGGLCGCALPAHVGSGTGTARHAAQHRNHSTSEQQQAQLPSPEALEQRLGINDSVYEAHNGASKISHSAQRQHCANGTLFMALP